MGIRVLLITQWFEPEPAFKGLVFARALVEKGFDVEVVTGFPNYPGGKVYDGYKIKIIQKEVIDGVRITRLPLYPSHDGSAFKRVLNYVSFAISTLFYCLFCAKKASVIYAYHPPLTVGLVAVFTKFFRKIPVVYDIQDMWPDTLRSTGMLNNEKLLGLIGWIAKRIYKRVDLITVLSPGFERLLVARGVDPNKIKVIPNWCDEQALLNPVSDINKDVFTNSERMKVVFAGNMGKAQALQTVIKAAEILESRKVAVEFIFIGGGLECGNLKKSVEELQLSNVGFYPQVSMNVIGDYLKKADVLLVHLRKDPLFSITIPSKTQAYLAVGKPILMGVEGDAADIISVARCGLVFEPENVNALVDAVTILSLKTKPELELLAQNSSSYYEENLSLASGVGQFVNIFKKLSNR